ncbi:hypothetical protein NDU88_006999 [Pleurodeles waltl]|uniref:Uncharacterized protein n=1 Tax=Pleurodeles waltl TaxID=8319 RepID=A0AAV7SR28_PLEWA|nr:hypothetical protein NDU88_006999 [Pleurodeles waltl]
MITALRGHDKVTRNILWYRNVTLAKDLEEEPEEFMWDAERSSSVPSVINKDGPGLGPQDQAQSEPPAGEE